MTYSFKHKGKRKAFVAADPMSAVLAFQFKYGYRPNLATLRAVR